MKATIIVAKTEKAYQDLLKSKAPGTGELEPFIKEAAEKAANAIAKGSCNKLLEKLQSSLDELTMKHARSVDAQISSSLKNDIRQCDGQIADSY